jgi:hypothetical protein
MDTKRKKGGKWMRKMLLLGSSAIFATLLSLGVNHPKEFEKIENAEILQPQKEEEALQQQLKTEEGLKKDVKEEITLLENHLKEHNFENVHQKKEVQYELQDLYESLEVHEKEIKEIKANF